MNLQLIGAGILAAALFAGGWQTRAWKDGAAEAARLAAQEAAREKLVEIANDVATRTEAAIQGIRVENRTVYNEIQKEVVRDPAYSCELPDAGRLRLNEARRRAAPAEPHRRLSSAPSAPR